MSISYEQDTALILNSDLLEKNSFSVSGDMDELAGDVLLTYTVPQAEYMYGCVATSVGMLLGYYDLYGYNGYDMSDLIAGTVSVNSRGSDSGSIYDMDDPSLLAQFIASDGYVSRFVEQTPADEKQYTFAGGDVSNGLNVSAWDSLADYLGTGQYWRNNSDLSTSHYFGTLAMISQSSQTYSVSGTAVPIKYIDFKYGLSLYVASRGYELSAINTASYQSGDFTFADIKAEIDAGRPVLISMNSGNYGHMVLAYGYNASTQEIIFDDTYHSDYRMSFNGTYLYSGKNYSISGMTAVVFNTGTPEQLLPELEISSFSMVSSATDKEALTLSFTVTNTGYASSGATVCRLYDGGNLLYTINIPALPVNSYSSANITLPSLTAGIHNIRLILDENNAVTELDESNNVFTHTLTVTSSALPDLFVSALAVSGENTEDDVVISFTVANGGAAPAGSFTIGIYNGKDQIGTVVANALNSGGSFSGTFTIAAGTLPVGTYDIAVKADDANIIAESSENNNIRSRKLTLSEPPVHPDAAENNDSWGNAYDLGSADSGAALANLTFHKDDLADHYRFYLSEAGYITVALTSSGVLPQWTLLDAGEQVIAPDHTGNSALLAAGEYYLQINSNGEVIRNYSLGITRQDIAPHLELSGTENRLSWQQVTGADGYVVKYYNAAHDAAVSLKVSSCQLDVFNPDPGTHQWEMAVAGDAGSIPGGTVNASAREESVELISSTANGCDDIFFADTEYGCWDKFFYARHAGHAGIWEGTGEMVALEGKTRFADIITGSADCAVLILSDFNGGDAIFVDDIYTALPHDVPEMQCRLAAIDEIRAGAGDDVIDLTSDEYDYADGITIYGGDGNDVIWSGSTASRLFGDAGDDRMIGGAGNDIFSGGSGGDAIHGGGGEDIFCFGAEWGCDQVEQLSGGSVTLWFASGSMGNWDASALTYRDGDDTVSVSGVDAGAVTLKFGDDTSETYAMLAENGFFNSAVTGKVWEAEGALA